MKKKKAVIIHGWEGNSEEAPLLWLKDKLKKKGFSVIYEDMPNTDEPKIEEWIPAVTRMAGDIDEETIMIGHSVGAQAVLRFMETLPEGIKVGQVILLAPWMELIEERIKEEGEEYLEIAKPWVETPIDWGKIKKHCDNFVGIYSDNDMYVPLSGTKLFENKLGAKSVIKHNRFHFDRGSGTVDLPEVLEEIE